MAKRVVTVSTKAEHEAAKLLERYSYVKIAESKGLDANIRTGQL
jgi:hypothetical protein